MYDQILFPVDGSEGATETTQHVVDIATHQDATVTVLFVADTNRASVTRIEGQILDTLVDTGEEIVGEVEETLVAEGIDCETDVVQGGPARTIVDYAEQYEHDLIAMPTHARTGLSRRLLGSVTEAVVRLSQTPVLTLRMDGETRTKFPYERILLPTDGSRGAVSAAAYGLDLAERLGAEPHVLSVVDDALLGTDLRSHLSGSDLDVDAQSAVDDVVQMAADRGRSDVVTEVTHGEPHEEICTYADAHDIDAIVIGTTGRSGIERILLGSVAEVVVRSADVPVISITDTQ